MGTIKEEDDAREADQSNVWTELGFQGDILDRISEAKYKKPTPIQYKTIPVILQGSDVIAIARTVKLTRLCNYTQ